MSNFIGGASKHKINKWLTGVSKKDSKVLILDGPKISTTKMISKIVKKKNLFTFGINIDTRLCKKMGINFDKEYSKKVLIKYKNIKFSIIYLDYMCTPYYEGNNFNVEEDINRASLMLKNDGFIAITFSKRHGNTTTGVHNLCPNGLYWSDVYEYCDSSPMIFVIFKKKKANLPKIIPNFKIGSIIKTDYGYGKINKINRIEHKIYLTHLRKYNNDFRIVKKSLNLTPWYELFGVIDKVIKF